MCITPTVPGLPLYCSTAVAKSVENHLGDFQAKEGSSFGSFLPLGDTKVPGNQIYLSP